MLSVRLYHAQMRPPISRKRPMVASLHRPKQVALAVSPEAAVGVELLRAPPAPPADEPIRADCTVPQAAVRLGLHLRVLAINAAG